MKSRHNGFTVIETLLLLILVAILGFTGYYVWHSQKQTDKTLNTASNTQLAAPSKKSSTSKTSTTANMIVFKELGVQIPSSTALKGLTYTVSGDKSNLLTPELSAAIAKCKGQTDTGQNSFEFLTKNTGTYSSSSASDQVSLKQFSGFWIGGTSSILGMTCSSQSDQQNLTNLYQTTQSALVSAFKSATLVQ